MFLAVAGPLAAMSIAGRQNRRDFMTQVTDAFVKEDYAALESTAADLRAKKDRFPDGVWTLPAFYDALELDQLPFENVDERLTHWKAAFPNSVALCIVELNALHGASRYDRHVQLAPNPERAAKAQATLASFAKADPPPGPDWYNAMLRLGVQQGMDAEEYNRLFDKAIAVEPGYLSLYFNKANYLRAYGDKGDWEAFALEAGRSNRSGEGMGIYARIAWSLSEGYADGYLNQYSTIQWPLMREGFRELDRKWPGSEWNLNNFCRFACLFGDRDTARELFARIDDNRWTTNWLSRSAFKYWRDWAMLKENPTAPPEQRLALKGGKDDPATQAWSLQYAPDGASLFVGYGGAHLVRWQLNNGAVQWETTLAAKGVLNAIETSPDGRWLAVGTAARMRDPNVPGSMAIWDLRTPKLDPQPTRWLEDGVCGVHAIRFSPDGQTVAASGFNQIVNQHGELRVWKATTWEQLRNIPDEKYNVMSIAFVPPDGRRLAYAASKGFNVVDSLSWEHLFWPSALDQHETFVFSMAASPDGKTLVCGTQDGYENRDHPAEITFWNTDGWTRRESPHVTSVGGIGTLQYSRDGRWLLGGGYDGILRAWDAATGKAAASWPPEAGAGKINAVAFSPDGHSVAAARDNGAVLVYRFDPQPTQPAQ